MSYVKYFPCRGWVVVEDHRIIAQASTQKQAEELAARLESVQTP